MIDEIKQKLRIIKAVYKFRKVVKNPYSTLWQYKILKKPYIELKLRKGGKLVVNDYT